MQHTHRIWNTDITYILNIEMEEVKRWRKKLPVITYDVYVLKCSQLPFSMRKLVFRVENFSIFASIQYFGLKWNESGCISYICTYSAYRKVFNLCELWACVRARNSPKSIKLKSNCVENIKNYVQNYRIIHLHWNRFNYILYHTQSGKMIAKMS